MIAIPKAPKVLIRTWNCISVSVKLCQTV